MVIFVGLIIASHAPARMTYRTTIQLLGALVAGVACDWRIAAEYKSIPVTDIDFESGYGCGKAAILCHLDMFARRPMAGFTGHVYLRPLRRVGAVSGVVVAV